MPEEVTLDTRFRRDEVVMAAEVLALTHGDFSSPEHAMRRINQIAAQHYPYGWSGQGYVETEGICITHYQVEGQVEMGLKVSLSAYGIRRFLNGLGVVRQS